MQGCIVIFIIHTRKRSSLGFRVDILSDAFLQRISARGATCVGLTLNEYYHFTPFPALTSHFSPPLRLHSYIRQHLIRTRRGWAGRHRAVDGAYLAAINASINRNNWRASHRRCRGMKSVRD